MVWLVKVHFFNLNPKSKALKQKLNPNPKFKFQDLNPKHKTLNPNPKP
jgi:hypothetical protein